MSSVLIDNYCSSETISYQFLLSGGDNPPPVPVGPGQSQTIPVPAGATAVGFVSFQGDIYMSAPGATISSGDLELAAFDGGATPPTLGTSVSAGGQVLLSDSMTTTPPAPPPPAGQWVLWTTSGPIRGSVAASDGVPEPLDSDVMWIGFTGVNGDIYTLAPGLYYPGYQAILNLFNPVTASEVVLDAFTAPIPQENGKPGGAKTY
jgi:hypothetical protein